MSIDVPINGFALGGFDCVGIDFIVALCETLQPDSENEEIPVRPHTLTASTESPTTMREELEGVYARGS